MKKTLASLVLAGSVLLGTTGCSRPDYRYAGDLNGEHVKYYEDDLFNNNKHLEVTKKNGKEIIYSCKSLWGSFRLTKIEVRHNGKVAEYDDEEVLKEGQKQFDAYLIKIKEAEVLQEKAKKEKAVQDISN